MPENVDLPGADLVDAAVEDLRAGVESPAALLVSMARGRLVDAGLAVPPAAVERPGHRLYDLLAEEDPGQRARPLQRTPATHRELRPRGRACGRALMQGA